MSGLKQSAVFIRLNYGIKNKLKSIFIKITGKYGCMRVIRRYKPNGINLYNSLGRDNIEKPR